MKAWRAEEERGEKWALSWCPASSTTQSSADGGSAEFPSTTHLPSCFFILALCLLWVTFTRLEFLHAVSLPSTIHLPLFTLVIFLPSPVSCATLLEYFSFPSFLFINSLRDKGFDWKARVTYNGILIGATQFILYKVLCRKNNSVLIP